RDIEQLLAQFDPARRTMREVSGRAARRVERCRLHVPSRLDSDAQIADVQRLPTHGSDSGGANGGARHQSTFQREARRMSTGIRRVCVVTGSRAEYGLLYWVLHELKSDSRFELQ